MFSFFFVNIKKGGLRQKAVPDLVEEGPEAVRLDGVAEVEAVGVELLDGRGGDDDTGAVAAKLNDIEGGEEGAAEGRGEAVVRGVREGEQVDGGFGLGADNLATGVGVEGRDGDGEERVHGGR